MKYSKEDILDILVLMLADEKYEKVDKLFRVAGEMGLTKDPDFIELTGELPADVLEKVGVETVYDFPGIGKVSLTPREVLELSEVPDKEIESIMRVKAQFGGSIVEIQKTA